MSAIDWMIASVIVISAIVSFVRGFFREAVSLATWIGAIFITLAFTSRVASLLPPDTFESPTARYLISAVLLFFGSMFLGALINWLFRQAVGSSTLGALDRLLGIVFGTARGALLVTGLVLCANLLPSLREEVWWRQSLLLPYFQQAARHVRDDYLPDELGRYFDLDSPETL